MRHFVFGVLLLASVGCGGPPFFDHLAGVPLGDAPHFHHNEVFVEGQDLYVAVDPNRYPSKIGDTYSIYVVVHKTHTEWDADPSLVDVTGAVETSTLTAGSLSNNKTQVWANMLLPSASHIWHKPYDVVFDFGNDGNYDTNDDILDRFGVLERPKPIAEETGGFTLVKDPASAGDFPVSTHEYNEGTFTVNVPGMYTESGDPKTINLIGKLYYPASSAGIDQPVITDLPNYPLIIIAHGRHGTPNSYLGYEYLGQHLASRGFIIASITLHELVQGWRIHHRGVTILKHVTALLSDPTTDAVITNVRTRMDSSRVGLLGHSRGGEGVVAAQEIFSGLSPGPSYAIRAVASFSPTDGVNWMESAPGGGPYDPVFPYLMIYGTRDGDLDGYAGNTGFRIVDRAIRPRHMITIYGANHNFFNETWGSDGSPTITRSEQETLAKVFITSFFSNNLLDQQAYVEMFSGYVVPPSVSAVGTTVLYSDQPERWVHLTIDDSQDSPSGEGTNSLGEANSSSGVSAFVEESLRYMTIPTRNYYTHDTDGLRSGWDSSGDSITFGIGDRAVWYYDFLNFRVGQRFRSSGNLNPVNTPQNLSVTISDALGNTSPPIVVSVFASIPYTDNVGVYTKSIMQAVRIPLRAFTANGSPLDLRRVTEVKFSFDQNSTGELILDDVEFLGLDITERD